MAEIRYAGNADEEEFTMMKSRWEYIKALAKKCSTLEGFYNKYKNLFEFHGNLMRLEDKYVAIDINEGFTDYQRYFVITNSAGDLEVSDTMTWQDNYCCTSSINLQTGEYADEEDQEFYQ